MNLSTEEFWVKMCSPRFRRLSRLSGQIGEDVFTTLVPPEEKDGFIAEKAEEALSCLKVTGDRLRRFVT